LAELLGRGREFSTKACLVDKIGEREYTELMKQFNWSVIAKGGGSTQGTASNEFDAVKAVERESRFFLDAGKTIAQAAITADCATCDGTGHVFKCRRHTEVWQHTNSCIKVCPDCSGIDSSVTVSLT